MRKVPSRCKGVTLLEILVSVMLLCSVMMTFAMVFPGGYRLNLKNRMESRGSQIASGIIAKIQDVRFLEPESASSTNEPSIEKLAAEWKQGITYPEIFESDIPAPFYLPDEAGLKGISVRILDRGLDGRGTLAKITVTVAWKESLKDKVLTKTVSLTTYRTRNRY